MKSIRILIVDDLPEVRAGLATLLHLATKKSSSKVEVVGEAQNGREAVQQARDLRPDVILMDLEMPVLDGYEATRRIKAQQPEARVIILSIHASPEAEQRARAAGADSFIVKGTSYQTLLNIILRKDGDFSSFEKGEKQQ